MNGIYTKAAFNKEEKFGVLRSPTMKVSEIVSFAIYRRVKDCETLEKVIIGYENGRLGFHSARMFGNVSKPLVLALGQSFEKHLASKLVRIPAKLMRVKDRQLHGSVGKFSLNR